MFLEVQIIFTIRLSFLRGADRYHSPGQLKLRLGEVTSKIGLRVLELGMYFPLSLFAVKRLLGNDPTPVL